MELTDQDIILLQGIFELISDRAAHYQDAEMDWNEREVTAFFDLVSRHRTEAKKRGFWWAK